MKEDHDARHGARELPPLKAGDKVWLPDMKGTGKVITETQPRSYTVETPTRILRRNRRQLNLLAKSPTQRSMEDADVGQDLANPLLEAEGLQPSAVTTAPGVIPEATPERCLESPLESPSESQPPLGMVLRSGRVV
eukprot:m.27950 g.27950  ORF g.27950 m.27950 type:complete len:136 (+) comp30498_c0_seq2:403-810(+)